MSCLPFLLYPVITLWGILGYDNGAGSYRPSPFIEYFSKPLKLDDLEGRAGREGGLLTTLSVLLVDQPCIREVTYGSTDGISPILLRSQHLLLVEEEYQCKVVI